VADLLAGIKVIDAANFIAGPVSTTVMADFGAEVIKVEPPTGDIYRVRGAGYPTSAYNFPWIVDNRTKRSVAIDLRTTDGQACCTACARRRCLRDQRADREPGASGNPLRGARGAQRAPHLCVDHRVRRDRDEASKPGFDSIALWARTGLMDLVRSSEDVPPARSLPAWATIPRASHSTRPS
jgi:formyl-CoA transferase